MTSVGCPPVASLARTVSPNNVEDTDSFDGDSRYARQLQEEEYEATRKSRSTSFVKNERRRSASLEEPRRSHNTSTTSTNPQSLDDDLKIPAVLDRKPEALRQSTSSAKHRSSSNRESDTLKLAPLNPDETSKRYPLRGHHLGSTCLEEAKKLVQRLRSIGADSTDATVSPVLADDELIDLVQAMFETQATFHRQGKPDRVNVGYHFCRGNNIKRIQQQPGLWSKIQSRGVNQSQDGEGIYTFNRPPSRDSTASASTENEDDVYMVVARLQGNQAPLMRSSGASRRQWNDEIDSLTEGDIVILRAPTQFFPMFFFRSELLVESAGRLKGNLRAMQLLQERLQYMLNDFFNSVRSAAWEDSALVSAPIRRSLSSPAEPIVRQPSRGTEEEETTHRLQRPQSFQESVAGVFNPAVWDLAREIQAFVSEHTALATAAMGSSLSLQTVVPVDELAVLVNNMLETQARFSGPGAEYVDIGYHYCRGQNLRKMQQKPGFWSSIQSLGYNKSEDGDGVYTFNNPMRSGSSSRSGFFDVRQSLSSHDDVWLLVARIQGTRMLSTPSNSGVGGIGRQWNEGADSIVLGGQQSDEVVVLKNSRLFFPLIQFRAADVHSPSGNSRDEIVQEIQMVHQRMQGILDGLFNVGASTQPDSVQLDVLDNEALDYEAPETLDAKRSVQGSSQQIYTVLSNNKKAAKDDCSICLDSLRRTSHQQVVRLNVCGHFFHQSCLHETLNRFDLCPICNQAVIPAVPQSCLQGLSPSGTMMVTKASQIFCSGAWAPRGGLIVSYFLPAGIQKTYHNNPGLSFSSANWASYLPYNEQGVMLLRRLQYAFLHGLLFSVETDEHGRDGIIWACVTHKTHPCNSRGITVDTLHSYPDPTYFERCHNELDRCGVPSNRECENFVRTKLQIRMMKAKEPPATMPPTMPSRTVRQCQRVLKGLREHPHGWMFCKALPIHGGNNSGPMDFEVIGRKLTQNEYSEVDDFYEDVKLVFEIAMMSHGKENPVYFMASQLKKKFKMDFKEMQLKKEA